MASSNATSNTHLLFPVSKDLVEKLIAICSAGDCGDCDVQQISNQTCDTCKRIYRCCTYCIDREYQGTKYNCILSKRCVECKKYFCKKCVNISSLKYHPVHHAEGCDENRRHPENVICDDCLRNPPLSGQVNYLKCHFCDFIISNRCNWSICKELIGYRMHEYMRGHLDFVHPSQSE